MSQFVKINKDDDVVVLLEDGVKGKIIDVDGEQITLLEDIPKGHKVAIKEIKKDNDVLKYGYSIGKAKEDIKVGQWIHSHNMRTGLDGILEYDFKENTLSQEKSHKDIFFKGYVRDNGEVGIRNEIWIINTVGCINKTCTLLAKEGQKLLNDKVDGIYNFEHPHGCSQLGDDLENTRKILSGLVNHPNAAGVLVVGLGCENNTLDSFKEILEPMGKRLKGIRLDSGDLSYLSKKARKMLDENGLRDCKILASNSLDEFIIRDLVSQDAKIDIYGVGERLITAKSEPVFGGVYKLMAVEENGEIVPRIKLSENVEKVTNPGYKQVWRLFDKESNKAIADVITLADEVIDDSREYEIFDPVHTWKKKLVDNFYAKKLQVPVFINGECVYESPAVLDIKAYCRESVNSLWDEQKRFTNPQEYYVDLSSELWNLKNEMINKYS